MLELWSRWLSRQDPTRAGIGFSGSSTSRGLALSLTARRTRTRRLARCEKRRGSIITARRTGGVAGSRDSVIEPWIEFSGGVFHNVEWFSSRYRRRWKIAPFIHTYTRGRRWFI
jgi:hypothetical protein